MVLEKLSSSLKNTLKKIAQSVFVDEKLINELVKDIQRALLQADVNVQLVFELTKKIKERALKEEAVSLNKKEHLIKIVYDELVAFLGGKGEKIDIKGKPFTVMLVGLFGSGKTTTSGKLAHFYKSRGHKVALVGLDVHRPAAMDQIEQIAKQADVPVYINREEKNVVVAWKQFSPELKKYDLVIVDTAGRDALSADLIQEIEALNKEITPNENLLVISADIGQAAQAQAEQFHKSCGITGVVATKMDGTARAGGALSACAITGAPIKFIGVGEKLRDIETFNPEGFVSRLLGMGDLEALLEKAEEVMPEDAEDLGKRFLKGEFNLIDLYDQMKAMKKMGSLSKLIEMVPGFSQLQLPKEALEVQEDKLTQWRYAMDSMTREELEEPETISGDRVERIANGSAVPVSEIRGLLKQYKQGKKMIKGMKGKGVEKMMKKFQQGQLKLK